MNGIRLELNTARRQYAQAKHGLAVANTMEDPQWKSRAFSYLNKSRARLLRAIRAVEEAIGRTR